MLRRIPPRPASAFLLFYGNKKHSQNGTGKKLKFPAFYQYRSGWFYFSLSGSNTAEAGYPGIPRSINMGIRVRLCSDWCLREADILSDYPQTSVSCIVRTQYPYFAQRYAGITGFGPILVLIRFPDPQNLLRPLHFFLRRSRYAFQRVRDSQILPLEQSQTVIRQDFYLFHGL